MDSKDHVKSFKEIYNMKQIHHENVIVSMFLYTLEKMEFNWYVNLPSTCIKDLESFKNMFLDQFKAFMNLTILHHQFISIKRDLQETISRFNHFFHMMYQRMESPYTIPLEVVIHIYLNSMDQLTTIFLRRLPTINTNTLEEVFQEVVTFTKQANPNGGGSMAATLLANTTRLIPPYLEGS